MSNPWDEFTNQKQWKEYLQNLVKTNDKALFRAILLIDQYQTPLEKAMGATLEKNNLGFGASDAEFLTSIAFRIRNNLPLTQRDIAISRNKMAHYWKQLYHLSIQKQKRRKEYV